MEGRSEPDRLDIVFDVWSTKTAHACKMLVCSLCQPIRICTHRYEAHCKQTNHAFFKALSGMLRCLLARGEQLVVNKTCHSTAEQTEEIDAPPVPQT